MRAVRHYHAKGLLEERDHSGYRRYDACAVLKLIRIRTLTEAGVPLARVRELLRADERGVAAAVADIDKRLRAEIRVRQRHRERIARLASGDHLALPPDVVEYLEPAPGARGRRADRPGRTRRLDPPGRALPRASAGVAGTQAGAKSPTRSSSASTSRWAGHSTGPMRRQGWSSWPTNWPSTSRAWPTIGARTTSTTPTSSRPRRADGRPGVRRGSAGPRLIESCSDSEGGPAGPNWSASPPQRMGPERDGRKPLGDVPGVDGDGGRGAGGGRCASGGSSARSCRGRLRRTGGPPCRGLSEVCCQHRLPATAPASSGPAPGGPSSSSTGRDGPEQVGCPDAPATRRATGRTEQQAPDQSVFLKPTWEASKPSRS